VETALVKAVTDLGYRDTVYHCTLKEGHVYVAGDFLAHNVTTTKILIE
jgi:intein/homing endonuclease